MLKKIEEKVKTLPTTSDNDWIIIMKNGRGNIDFNKKWEDYKNGFGLVSGDYWLGLEELYRLTNQNDYELQVDIEYYNKTWKHAHYDHFLIKNEKERYQLILGAYNQSSTAADSLSHHSGMNFQTSDIVTGSNIVNYATFYRTGWWYNNGFKAKLTGVAFPKETEDFKGIIWNYDSKGRIVKTAKAAIMKIRKL